MKRRLFIALAILPAACGLAFSLSLATAHDAESPHDGERVKLIAQHDMIEKLDGEAAAASVVEVKIAPGQEGHAHRHPGPVIVYVVEGTYELGIDDKPIETFKMGESFYEPSGCLHRVSRNPSKTEQTRLIAVVLHPRDAKEVAIPEPQQK